MKSTAAARAGALPLIRARFADYLELTRLRIAAMVLCSRRRRAFVWLAPCAPDHARLLHTLVGTALVTAGASALNQVLEQDGDARMGRTHNRPLPSGRLPPLEALLFGMGLALAGLAYLALTVRRPLAVLTAAFAFAAYVFLYTPLKRKTNLKTLVGAVAGAAPPVIGWTAATNALDLHAFILFAILFLWQVPHFLAIAWLYRDDYARAGLRMLPVQDPGGGRTARRMAGYSLALLAASLAPSALGCAGGVYLLGAVVLGVGFLTCAVGFLYTRSAAQARRVLRASLFYLPALFTVLLIDGMLRSWAGPR